MRFPSGFSKGYGFVYYSKAAEAEKACITLNGSSLRGNRLDVSPARPKFGNQRPISTYTAMNTGLLPLQSFRSKVPSLGPYSPLLGYPASLQCYPSTSYFPFYTASNYVLPLISGCPIASTKLYSPSTSDLYPYCTTASKHVYQPKPCKSNVSQQYQKKSAVLPVHSFHGNAHADVAVRKAEREVITKRENSTQNVSMRAASKRKHLERKQWKCKSTAAEFTSNPPACGFPSTMVGSDRNCRFKDIIENLEPQSVKNLSSVQIEVNEAGLLKLLSTPNPLPTLVGKTFRVLKEANMCSGTDGTASLSRKCSSEANEWWPGMM